jgi:hypothetical protein
MFRAAVVVVLLATAAFAGMELSGGLDTASLRLCCHETVGIGPSDEMALFLIVNPPPLPIAPLSKQGPIVISATRGEVDADDKGVIIKESDHVTLEFRLTNPIVCDANPNDYCAVTVLITNTEPGEIALSSCYVEWDKNSWNEPRYGVFLGCLWPFILNFLWLNDMTFFSFPSERHWRGGLCR